MKHLGNITQIKGSCVPLVDIVTGGSPCQDLSIAGQRKGLAGERSGLFMEQIRIIKEMRDECERRLYDAGADYNRTDIKPRYMVWENVSGAFSSNKGEDFRAVLEETAKVADKDAYVPGLEGGKWSPCGCILGNGWSIAWRLHDSQWFGVPQRRKRICLLADFNGDTAGKVLFELQRETTAGDTEQAIVDIGTESRSEVQSVSKGLSGDIAQSGKEGERVAEDTERCTGEASYTLKIRGGVERDSAGKKAGKGPLVQTELSATLGVSQDQTLITVEQQKQIEDFVSGVNAEAKHQQDLIQSDLGVARTLAPGTHASGSHLTKTLVTSSINAGDNQQAVVYGIGSYDSNAMKSDNPHSGIYQADTSRTLDLNGGNPGCNQGGMAVVQGFDSYNQASTGDVAMPLRNKAADSGHIPVVCIEGNGQRDSHKGDGYKESDTMYTLNTVEQHGVCYGIDQQGGKGGAAYTVNVAPTMASDSHGTPHAVCYSEDKVNAFDNYNMSLTGEVAKTLQSEGGDSGVNEGCVLIENHPADSRVKIAEDGICQTLSGRMGTGGGNVPMVMEPQTFSDVAGCRSAADGTKGVHSQMMKNPEENFILEPVTSDGDIAGTLDASYYKGCGERQGIERTVVAMTTEITPKIDENNTAFSLRSRDYKDPQSVAYDLDRAAYNQGQNAQYNFSVDEEKVETCVAKGPNAVCKAVDCLNGREKDVNGTLAANARKSLNSGNVVRCESVVRRLTPMECERLQGFPDNWTNIGDWVDSKGKTHKGDSDSPRYKALGNSIALPFWQWMAERMMPYLPENPTMASLFDGIGGFPLVFSRCGCKPVWASEIEEFPIAVTKIRFPEEG